MLSAATSTSPTKDSTLGRAVTSWKADDRRWYLDLVAQAEGDFCSLAADGLPTNALDRYESLPWDRCILLAGDGESRRLDVNGALWSDDRHGRWFESRSKPLVWLHQRIGQMNRGDERPGGTGEVASHICGYCSCIRAEHIIYQPVREDRLDRAYHKAMGRGNIRPEHVPKHFAISSPVTVMGPMSVMEGDRV